MTLTNKLIENIWLLICSKTAVGMVLLQKRDFLISEGINQAKLCLIDSLISNNNFAIASCKELHKIFTTRFDYVIYLGVLKSEAARRADIKKEVEKVEKEAGIVKQPLSGVAKPRAPSRKDSDFVQIMPKTESDKKLNQEAFNEFKRKIVKLPFCINSTVGDVIKIESFFFSGREKDLFASEIRQQVILFELLCPAMDYYFKKGEYIAVTGSYGSELNSWSLRMTNERKSGDVLTLNRQLANFSIVILQELAVLRGFKLFLDSEVRPDVGLSIPASVTRWANLLPSENDV